MPINRNAFFDDILKKYQRIGITGSPRAGKSTLSRRVKDRPVIHADGFKELGWSEASAACRDTVNVIKGPLVVEGVAVPRAVRKGMLVDVVIVLDEPLVELSPGQKAMARGVTSVLKELTVPVIYAPPAPKDYNEYEED